MLPRLLQPLLQERLKHYPAVALIGARQSGKTTLARKISNLYFDLEQPSDRLRLDLAWERLIRMKKCIILDEAQAWPEIFPRLRSTIDRERRRCGRFLILGSVSPSIMTHVSESLTGRLSLVELTPFIYPELKTPSSRKRHWLCGGFPDGGVLSPGRFPQWQKDYLTLLCQRDLPVWGFPAKPLVTQRFLQMTAALHGQLWNASQVGQSLGLSYHTVNSYLDYLEGAFLLRRLPPYSGNLRKRLVKAPKIYWRDTGLLHALLKTSTTFDLLRQPWVGFSWEGYVIEQAMGTLSSLGKNYEAFFLRTSDRYELDLILKTEREIFAVEIKLTAFPEPSDMDRLKKTADWIGATKYFLVTQTSRTESTRNCFSCNLEFFLEQLKQI